MNKFLIAIIFTFLLLDQIAAQEMEIVGTYESEGNICDIQIRGNYVFLASGEADFEIIDVNDPQSPCRIGQYQDYRNALLLAIERNRAYIYLWAAYEPLEIAILDISDYSNPQYLGAYYPENSPENRIRDIACSDTLLFTANFYDGMKIINVADPGYPYIISAVLPPDVEYGTGTTYLFTDPPYCYVGCFNDFMWYGYTQFINILNPADPVVVSEFTTGSFGSIIVRENIGYLASYDEVYTRFDIYDLSDPSTPNVMGSYRNFVNSVIAVEDLCVNNDQAFLLLNFNGQATYIKILDLSDPANPVLEGAYNPGEYFQCIDCSEDYFFVGTDNNLRIMRYVPTTINNNSVNKFHYNFNLIAFPNPFNVQTTISFSLACQSQVNISIYDITGRLVDLLASKYYDVGKHELVWDATGQPSGIYFARLRAGEYFKTNRMVLLK